MSTAAHGTVIVVVEGCKEGGGTWEEGEEAGMEGGRGEGRKGWRENVTCLAIVYIMQLFAHLSCVQRELKKIHKKTMF